LETVKKAPIWRLFQGRGAIMKCYSPIRAWRIDTNSITFKEEEGKGNAFPLPCNKCLGCRLEKSRQWAVRCVHEAQMHEESCFITLTYKEMPEGNSLNKKHFQDFMKRLRKKLEPKKIKYFACGEYGEKLERPHYHAIIFGHDFSLCDDDNVCEVQTYDEEYGATYSSSLLADVWGHGFVTVGACTFETAAYVARYCTKKINGDLAENHYKGKTPEFGLMSKGNAVNKNNAIGLSWIKKFYKDLYPSNTVVHENRKFKIPAYYDKWMEKNHPELYEAVKQSREEKLMFITEDDLERMHVKHQVNYKMTARYKRALEGAIVNNNYDTKLIKYRKETL
jgi:hypothetical protein